MKKIAGAVVVTFALSACSGSGSGGAGGGSAAGGGTSGAGGGTSGSGGGTNSSGGGTNSSGGGTSGTGGGGSPVFVTLTGKIESGNGTSVPLAGATVEVVAAAPAISTTTDSDGGFTMRVPATVPIFIRGSLASYKSQQQGLVLGLDGGGGGNFSINLISNADFNQIGSSLSPPLTPSPSDGIFIVELHSQSALSGLFSVSVSAAHSAPFTVIGNNNPSYIDGGITVGGTGGNPYVFPAVVPGTSTITITPPGATSCTLDQPITDWRIDPDVFTRAVANCQ